MTQNIYVGPFPEEIRRAGERIKIIVMQKWGNKAIWRVTFGTRAGKLLNLNVPGWRNCQTHRD